MRSWKIFVACLSLITVPVLIESCCGFGENWDTNFSINSFSTQILDEKGLTSPPASASLNKYMFQISMDVDYRQAHLGSSKATMAVFACEPDIPVGDQKISEFRLFSNNAFSTGEETVAAGESLAQMFRFISYPNSEKGTDAILGEELYDTQLFLVSDKSVNSKQRHQLKAFIKLDDGRNFEVTFDEVEFTP